MLLGYSLTPFGHDPDAWRHKRDGRLLGFDALLDQVAAAEAAGLDFVLLADRLSVRPTEDLSPVAVPMEPTLLASALSTRVGTIGIIAAASTAQHEPYNLARRFASLDLIGRGRTGWLVIADGDNTALESEYLDVVAALWDSFEDDAFLYDKTAGRFFDPSKMHVAHHRGAHFSVRGPLNVNRSPQGRPVVAHLVKDGDSALAARTGDLFLLQARTSEEVITAAGQALTALEAAGRRRDDVRLFASIIPIVGAGARETQETLGLFERHSADHPLAAIRIAGTAAGIADQLQELASAAGLDGFTILPPTLEMGRRFLSDVAPDLRQRGLTGLTTGPTLRDRLGLARLLHPSVPGQEMAR